MCFRGTSEDNGRHGHHREDGQLAHPHLRHVAGAAQPRHRQLVPGQQPNNDLGDIGERRGLRAADHGRDRVERRAHVQVCCYCRRQPLSPYSCIMRGILLPGGGNKVTLLSSLSAARAMARESFACGRRTFKGARKRADDKGCERRERSSHGMCMRVGFMNWRTRRAFSRVSKYFHAPVDVIRCSLTCNFVGVS